MSLSAFITHAWKDDKYVQIVRREYRGHWYTVYDYELQREYIVPRDQVVFRELTIDDLL